MTTIDTLWFQIKEKARGYGADGARPNRTEAEAIIRELLEDVEIAESVPGEARAFYADEFIRLCGPQSQRVPLVIALTGELDSFACDDMRQLLRPAAQVGDVVLDFSGVQYIDSSTLSTLIVMHRERIKRGLPAARISGLSKSMRRIFTITALDEVWPIFDTVDDAIASFSAQ